MQELANSDASESTLIASRGQEGFSSDHPTPKLQQRPDRISQPLWGTEEQIRSLPAASGWQYTGSSKVDTTGLAQGVLRLLAQLVCPSCTTQCPADKTYRQLWHSFASDGPIQAMWSSKSLW